MGFIGRVDKKEKFTAADQSKRSSNEKEIVVMKKKKTSTLTLISMNQLTWPLFNFLFLK